MRSKNGIILTPVFKVTVWMCLAFRNMGASCRCFLLVAAFPAWRYKVLHIAALNDKSMRGQKSFPGMLLLQHSRSPIFSKPASTFSVTPSGPLLWCLGTTKCAFAGWICVPARYSAVLVLYSAPGKFPDRLEMVFGLSTFPSLFQSLKIPP